MDTIELLTTRYKTKLSELEEEAKTIRTKLDTLIEVAKMAKEEGFTPKQEELYRTSSSVPVVGKYSKMSMTEAIIDILNIHPDILGNDIYQELLRNGFTTVSKHLKQDMYKRLGAMRVSDKIEYNAARKGKTTFRLKRQVRGEQAML